MPHKLPLPQRTVCVYFKPTRMDIKPHLGKWYLRLRQTSDIGDSWIVAGTYDSHQLAIEAAQKVAADNPQVIHFITGEKR